MTKRRCITFGNCQAPHIVKLLELFTNFDEIYEVSEVFSNYEIQDPSKPLAYNSSKSMQFKSHLENADLIIYQPLTDQHGCYSTNRKNENSFFRFVKPNATLISFPRLYTSVLWPIFHKRENQASFCGRLKNPPATLEELLFMYDNNLLDFDFEERIKENYTIAKQKEEDCNVKIADYIYGNLSKLPLFATENHPNAAIMIEVARQIAVLLQLDFDSKKATKLHSMYPQFQGLPDSVYKRQTNSLPISRYAIKYFKFDFCQEEDRDADRFYRNVLIHYFSEVHLKRSLGTYPFLLTTPRGVIFQHNELSALVGYTAPV